MMDTGQGEEGKDATEGRKRFVRLQFPREATPREIARFILHLHEEAQRKRAAERNGSVDNQGETGRDDCDRPNLG